MAECVSQHGSIRLRPAQPADESLLEQIYASTRAEELAVTGWSDEQKAQFCRMQFVAQDKHYRTHYPRASFDVIEHAGVAAGRLYVDRPTSEIHIIDISLLPAHRGVGLGTKLLTDLQAEARATARSLGIYVEKFNPALRLYQRLGFRPIEDQGVYLRMKWSAQ